MDIPIYHITHINNLESILTEGGLWCDAKRLEQGLDCENIAYGNIKERRARKTVPVEPYGHLDEYVPFYFSNRSPMLFAINSGSVEGLAPGAQQEIIYLVSGIATITSSDCDWCFTDGHAVEEISRFFKSPLQLDQIDWEVIRSWSWKHRIDDMDRKRRKQAEFLVYQFVGWRLFNHIGVYSQEMKGLVSKLMGDEKHRPRVSVEKKWYY